MRSWGPTFTNGIQNSIDGNDIPNTDGSNANKAQALLDTEGGLLGGGPSADQGAGGGGISGGAGNGARAPGPGPMGGGGAGPGSSGGSDGGAGTPGGRTTPNTCGKDTDPPAPDPHNYLNRSHESNHINAGGNAANNATNSAPMPGTTNQTCNGQGKNYQGQKGCPDCEFAKFIDFLMKLIGG